jgi:hypothetical protein
MLAGAGLGSDSARRIGVVKKKIASRKIEEAATRRLTIIPSL